jgi:hypothetical protein
LKGSLYVEPGLCLISQSRPGDASGLHSAATGMGMSMCLLHNRESHPTVMADDQQHVLLTLSSQLLYWSSAAAGQEECPTPSSTSSISSTCDTQQCCTACPSLCRCKVGVMPTCWCHACVLVPASARLPYQYCLCRCSAVFDSHLAWAQPYCAHLVPPRALPES